MHHEGPDDLGNHVDHEYRCALATAADVRLDPARESVDERDVGCLLGESFKGHGDERAGVAARGEQGDLPALEVGRVDGAFFAAREHADDAAEGGGLLYEGQEVDDKPGARMVGQGYGDVETF